jgi:hypothetical protein
MPAVVVGIIGMFAVGAEVGGRFGTVGGADVGRLQAKLARQSARKKIKQRLPFMH